MDDVTRFLSVFSPGFEYEFRTCPDADACMSCNVADAVIALTPDRDQSSLFPVVKRPNQVVLQVRRLYYLGSELCLTYCDSVETVHVLAAKLLPRTSALLGPACNFLADAWCLLPPEHQMEAFMVSSALCSRTEFTGVKFFGQNLHGDPRNAPFNALLRVADSILVQRLAQQPAEGGRVLRGF
jgi:hypothetical protein